MAIYGHSTVQRALGALASELKATVAACPIRTRSYPAASLLCHEVAPQGHAHGGDTHRAETWSKRIPGVVYLNLLSLAGWQLPRLRANST